jgi:alpha,alpha-trehalase
VVAVSNYYPLWAGGFRGADASVDLPKRLDRIVQSLKDSGLIQVAGVQTTTLKTTQQWDAPNAWPPLQDILIEGLLKVETNSSRALAKELVQKWIDTGYAAWTKTGLMFEKYDATLVGGLGAGGEYEPQFGFGWTNGVVLKFLTEYPDLLQ